MRFSLRLAVALVLLAPVLFGQTFGLSGQTFGLSGQAFGQEKPPLPGAPNDAAVASYKRGEALLKARKYVEAARAFDDAARRAPLFHLAHYAAGNALARSATRLRRWTSASPSQGRRSSR